jgi:hypothetical protein
MVTATEWREVNTSTGASWGFCVDFVFNGLVVRDNFEAWRRYDYVWLQYLTQ